MIKRQKYGPRPILPRGRDHSLMHAVAVGSGESPPHESSTRSVADEFLPTWVTEGFAARYAFQARLPRIAGGLSCVFICLLLHRSLASRLRRLECSGDPIGRPPIEHTRPGCISDTHDLKGAGTGSEGNSLRPAKPAGRDPRLLELGRLRSSEGENVAQHDAGGGSGDGHGPIVVPLGGVIVLRGHEVVAA